MLTPELGTTKVIYLKEDFQPSLVERNLTESQLRIFSGGKSCFKVKQHLMPARHKPGKALVSCLVTGHSHREQCWAGMSHLCLKPQQCPHGASSPQNQRDARNELSQTGEFGNSQIFPGQNQAAGDALLIPLSCPFPGQGDPEVPQLPP